jgi:hypothetical protein
MKCSKCNEILPQNGDHIFCTGCSTDFHFECSGVRESTYRNMSIQKKNEWRCMSCRTGKSRTNSTSSTEASNLQETILQINKKLEILLEVNNKVEDVQKHISAITEEMKIYKEKVTQLESIIQTKEKKIEELESRMLSMEQYSRRKNLEIIGLNKMKDENLEQAFENMCHKLEIDDITRKDIETIHRVPNKDPKKEYVIVQMKTQQARNRMLMKNKIEIRNRDIWKNNDDTKIYIKENQSKDFKKLFWEIKLAAKEKGFKFIWSRNGRILIRKDERSRIICLRGIKELQTIEE